MVSEPLNVTCPHCGAMTAAATGPDAAPDRLKGVVKNCADCESPFELYYY